MGLHCYNLKYCSSENLAFSYGIQNYTQNKVFFAVILHSCKPHKPDKESKLFQNKKYTLRIITLLLNQSKTRNQATQFCNNRVRNFRFDVRCDILNSISLISALAMLLCFAYSFGKQLCALGEVAEGNVNHVRVSLIPVVEFNMC